ncbi:Lrp/AsnC family transcriptional regulator, partial [Streptomyces venezuelae]|uniref:Lrp/AsnC family transcriptional regulator n=1 Tax=Streptomyces venezuelae TaxID=54571 RepID=UPI003662033C
MRLNDLDERIVHALAEDARRSYADIGQLVGLSAPAVKRRVDRLRATGAITGFTVRVDPAALGWETEGFIEGDTVGWRDELGEQFLELYALWEA